jgi:hypothetical protein
MANSFVNYLEIYDSAYPENPASVILRNIQRDVPPDEDLSEIIYGYGSIDFNKIIPEPSGLIGKENLSMSDIKKNPNNWYTWRKNNWGVPFNPFFDSFEEEEEPVDQEYGAKIRFFTGGSPVPKVITALSNKYGNNYFLYSWFDRDDIGSEVGWSRFKWGNVVESYIPYRGSAAALELVFKLARKSPKDMGYFWDKKQKKYKRKDTE